jgi:hypothetical protein
MERPADRAIVVALWILVWAGCSSGSEAKAVSDAGPGDGAVDVGEGGAAGAPGDGGLPDRGDAEGDAGGTSALVVSAPSFSVAVGGESTQCVVLDLGNATVIQVGEIESTLSPVVYELRIAAVSDAAQTTPSPCTPFADIDDQTVRPLVFARNRSEDLSFPTGVGYTLAAHQLLRFEVHAANATAGALDASVSATFRLSPAATIQEAGLLLLEAADINIQADATATLGPIFFPLSGAFGSASIFRLMGYTHALGVSVAMATLTSAGDPSPALIYSPPAWDPGSPLVVTKAPPVVLPAPGGIGLTCSWNNSAGAGTVTRGPSVNDERCVGVVSYYPAVAPHACVNTGLGAGVTVCCPGGSGCP